MSSYNIFFVFELLLWTLLVLIQLESRIGGNSILNMRTCFMWIFINWYIIGTLVIHLDLNIYYEVVDSCKVVVPNPWAAYKLLIFYSLWPYRQTYFLWIPDCINWNIFIVYGLWSLKPTVQEIENCYNHKQIMNGPIIKQDCANKIHHWPVCFACRDNS